MDFTGKFKNAYRDVATGELNITFTMNEKSALPALDSIKDCAKLSITAKKYSEKRSNNANAYAWVLMQKIAEAIGSNKDDVYLECLKKYSRAFTHIIVKENAIEQVKAMYRTVVDLGNITVGNTTGHQLQVYYGSSTFDTKEMSVFIDGIVGECHELGIETMTPADIERMKATWQNIS